MWNAGRSALFSTLLLAAALGPLGALGSIQHSSMALDKRSIPAGDGSECCTEFAKNPQKCPIVRVEFFSDVGCSEPLELHSPGGRALIKGNTEMLFDGAVSHSIPSAFRSFRVVAAVPGIGIGFAQGEESDDVVQNMAWLSAAETYKAFKAKSCVFPRNLDGDFVKVWSVKFEDTLNQPGYVWNELNLPLNGAYECMPKGTPRLMSKLGKRIVAPPPVILPKDGADVCLEKRSFGGGGMIALFDTDDCTGPYKTQLYNTVQCTPLATSSFKSFRAVEPIGPTIPMIFSPVYYDLGKEGYHACAQQDVTKVPFPNGTGKCQKFDNQNMFVGIYGNDPQWPQPGPGKKDKVLLQSHGGLLLAPNPNAGGKQHPK